MLNWAKGFFRIWVCASVCYVLIASVGLFEDIRNQILLQDLETISSPDCDKGQQKRRVAPSNKKEVSEVDIFVAEGIVVVDNSAEFLECLKREDAEARTENLERLMELLAMILLPPIALLAFVFIAIKLTKWVGKGFKNDRTI